MATVVAAASEQTPLLSPYWYRIATLTPGLRRDIRITRQPTRGVNWIVLSRRDHGGQIRLNPAAWEIIARCDGKSTLESIWQHIAKTDAQALPSQNLLLPLLAQLVRQGYLLCNDWPNLDEQEKERQQQVRKSRWQRFNPFAPRIRLGDPSRLIEQVHHALAPWLGRTGMALAALLVGAALLTSLLQWSQLTVAVPQAFGDARFWVLSWCLYPVIKLVHELAHGIVLRHYGGRTPEMGLALLMLMPAPYVDASDANRLERSTHRAAVSAAGIGAELIMAAAAFLLWLWLEPGLIRDGLLAIAVIGSFSTVIFNANPLIRFDGYYVLTDLIELPGLAERSSAYWRQLWQHRLLGLPGRQSSTSQSESNWLIAYAPAAWLYRLTLLLWVANWLGAYSRALGFTLLAVALTTQFLLPLIRLFLSTSGESVSIAQATSARLRLAGALLTVGAIGLLPVPDRSVVQAIASLPETARIKATQAGYVSDTSASDQHAVDSGTVVVTLLDPLLEAQIQTQISLTAGLKNQWVQSLSGTDPSMNGAYLEALNQARRKLTFLRENQRKLLINSPTAGQIKLIHYEQDLPGRFIKAGDLIGVVRQMGDLRLRAALNEDQANRLRQSRKVSASAQASVSSGKRALIAANLVSVTPDAIATLPSAALAEQSGGQIPTEAGKDGLVPTRPTYLAELTVSAEDQPAWVAGQRVWVRLDFGTSSILSQGLRAFGQMINTRMAPGWS